jgi:hypothetical protein
MRTRRGSVVLASDFAKQVARFAPGDIVTSVITGSVDFIGEVVDVDPRLKKISVNWGDGSSVQHDPDEIQLAPHYLVERMEQQSKMASRRPLLAKQDTDVPAGDMFVGDPKTHGIETPRGGGFNIMQQLQKDLHEESEEEADEGPLVSPIQERTTASRRCRNAAIVKRMTTTWNDDGSIIESTDIEWDPEDASEVWQGKTASDMTAAKKADVPDDLLAGRKRGNPLVKVSVNVSGDKVKVVWEAESGRSNTTTYSNDWEGWHNGVKKGLNLSMPDDRKFNAWAKKSLGVDIPQMLQENKAKKGSSEYDCLRSRRAMYWMDKGRTYRLTKNEQNSGSCTCPRCREQMNKEKFTRSEKLLNCPGCGFKIPSSKVQTQRKVEVEIEPDGTVEVEVEPVGAE